MNGLKDCDDFVGGQEGTSIQRSSHYVHNLLISSDVLQVCWTHAYTNQNEEVMGLLIGSTEDNTVTILSLYVTKRSTRERFRVEIDPLELSKALDFAASLQAANGEKLRLVGWYHSHPKLAVLPSQVDLRTQASYQLMDPRFVGLIFSVYNMDTKSVCDKRQVTAFQSVIDEAGEKACAHVPITVHPTLSMISKDVFTSVYSALGQMWTTLVKEEQEHFDMYQYQKSDCFDGLAEMNNQSQLTLRLCQIYRRIVQPTLEFMENKLYALQQLEKVCEAGQENVETLENGDGSRSFNGASVKYLPSPEY